MANGPAISIRGLRTAFGTKVIHDALDLDVRRGEVLAIVGGSGSGKSVLLREIIGLIEPVEGEIQLFGRNQRKMSPHDQRQQRLRIGVLFQDGALFSSLTVSQNIQVPIRNSLKLPDHLLEEIAGVKLALAGLPPDAGPKYPGELSGGMRKRAGLARALALDPELLFLDEPTAGLDPVGAHDFDMLIRSLQRSLGLTVVMITHDMDSLAAISDRIAALVDKRAIVDTMENLRAMSHPWLQAYFDGPRGRAAARSHEKESN